MKIKQEKIDSSVDVGVAKASKAIKKEKGHSIIDQPAHVFPKISEKMKKKQEKMDPSVDVAVAKASIAIEKEKVLPVVENSNGTELPPKRHKKKDAKRLARLAAGGKVENVKSKKSPKAKTKLTKGGKQGKNAKDNSIDHGAAQPDKKPLDEKKKVKAVPDDEKVDTSESENEQEDSTEIKTEVKEKERKKVTSEYTIFIGNLPTTTKQKMVRNLFQKYGTILSTRFRTNTGEIINRKKLMNVPALNCYVRFAKKDQMTKACEMDGHIVGENRIRVTPQDIKPLGPVTSTVFVGNLREGTTETELYDFFSTVGEIEYVRLIANRYVAYVCFKKGVSIKKAFKLDQQMLNGRPIRVQQVDPNITNLKSNKKGHLVKKNRLPNQTNRKNEGTKPVKDFHGQVVSAKKKQKKSFSKTAKANRSIAEKLKAAMNFRNK